jgi:hypothetical protein
VEKNVRLAEEFEPLLDVAALPQLTAGIYEVEDAER